uniref:Uncharacterized protein n=1 Tax=Haptolina brevifila TaxID=156173 RepID=A0A7S2ILH2_9EUKA|mmetsp:Transcript_67525/g.133926  ORF Transcript_67525/g.133926 Transcript_67525/m.133926 type:complete len:124 (+) Transcript_67525:59-430(+)
MWTATATPTEQDQNKRKNPEHDLRASPEMSMRKVLLNALKATLCIRQFSLDFTLGMGRHASGSIDQSSLGLLALGPQAASNLPCARSHPAPPLHSHSRAAPHVSGCTACLTAPLRCGDLPRYT